MLARVRQARQAAAQPVSPVQRAQQAHTVRNILWYTSLVARSARYALLGWLFFSLRELPVLVLSVYVLLNCVEWCWPGFLPCIPAFDTAVLYLSWRVLCIMCSRIPLRLYPLLVTPGKGHFDDFRMELSGCLLFPLLILTMQIWDWISPIATEGFFEARRSKFRLPVAALLRLHQKSHLFKLESDRLSTAEQTAAESVSALPSHLPADFDALVKRHNDLIHSLSFSKRSADQRRSIIHAATYVLWVSTLHPFFDYLDPLVPQIRRDYCTIDDYYWQRLTRAEWSEPTVSLMHMLQFVDKPLSFLEPLGASYRSSYLLWHLRAVGRLTQSDAISKWALETLAEYKATLLPLVPLLDEERWLEPLDEKKRVIQQYIHNMEIRDTRRRLTRKAETELNACILELALVWKEGRTEREGGAWVVLRASRCNSSELP